MLSRGLPVYANPFVRVHALLRAAAGRLADMHHAAEGRRALARMDARMLADIGISRGEAQVEIRRRPWDTGAVRPRG